MCRNSKESTVGTELLKNPYQVTRTEGKCDIVLIDFDCAKKYSNGTHYGQIGTECHHAPEMFIDKGTASFNGYDYKVDIFASGMTFAELMFGLDSCYTDLIDMNLYIEHAMTRLDEVSSNKRTTSIANSHIRNTVLTLQLIKSMLSVNPNDRPTSNALVKKIKHLLV
jgi:serine/threonine protein kinase